MVSQHLNWLNSAVVVALIGVVGGIVAFFVRGIVEKRNTNKAVLAEIRRLLVVIREHKEWYEKKLTPSKRLDYPLIPFSHPVYDKQVDNIGILNWGLVAKVVRFYGYVDFLNALQSARAKHPHSDDFDLVYLDALGRCESIHHFDNDFKKRGIPVPSEHHG
jgi:type II secretory pathway pseudopilin PulG